MQKEEDTGGKSGKFLIRETFIAKPGHAGEFAKMMKDEMEKWPDFKGYVLLDIATDYNKIVCEYEIDSLDEFEKMIDSHKKELAEKDEKSPPKYTELYMTGKREIFRIL